MTCKGICIRHKAQKPVGSGRYASGQKRCQICEIKPRNLKYKAKLRARTSGGRFEAPPVLTVRRK
jgi:hypothetical protein